MKTITRIPWGGLANRLRAVESGVNLAKQCHARLRILWFRNSELGCRFSHLFHPIDDDSIEVKEASPLDFFLFSRSCKRNLHLPTLYKGVYLKDRYHEVTTSSSYSFDYLSWAKGRDVYIMSCYPFYEESHLRDYSYFRPLPAIQDKMDTLAKAFPPDIVGMHIRRTDNTLSIQNSPTELFIKKIEEETNSSFYLATDSLDEKQRLKALFGDRIHYYDCILNRNTVEGIRDALIELYLLSKTTLIYGSYHSSFSELAAEMGNIQTLTLIEKREDD